MASESDAPPTKRPRTEAADKKPAAKGEKNGLGKGDENILDPIALNVLGRADELASAYREASPYPHGMIHGFCNDGVLGECAMNYH